MQIYSALVEASTISVALQDTLNQVFVYVAQIEYSPAISSKKTPFFFFSVSTATLDRSSYCHLFHVGDGT